MVQARQVIDKTSALFAHFEECEVVVSFKVLMQSAKGNILKGTNSGTLNLPKPCESRRSDSEKYSYVNYAFLSPLLTTWMAVALKEAFTSFPSSSDNASRE